MGTGRPTEEAVPDPTAGANPAATQPGTMGGGNQAIKTLRRYDFEVQFAWIPTPPTKRLEKKESQNAAEGADRPEAGRSDR
jgi:hypothetical protein